MTNERFELGLDAVEIPSLLWLVRDGMHDMQSLHERRLEEAASQIEDRLCQLGYLPAPTFDLDEIVAMIRLFEMGHDRNLATISDVRNAPGLRERVGQVKLKLAALLEFLTGTPERVFDLN